MKKLARRLVAALLYWQVKRLQKKNSFQIIAVEGSIGKTSTKMAIASLLTTKLKVRYQTGNYNDLVTVPLVIFGQPLVHLFNPLSWLLIFIKNEWQILKPFPYQAVILELGTDGPGYLAEFTKYLNKIDINVLTGIAPEHMEFFKDLDAVATEETTLTNIASLNLVNADMCDAKYLSGVPQMLSYGITVEADYKLEDLEFNGSGSSFKISAGQEVIFKGQHEAISEPLVYAVFAAVIVAHKMGLGKQEIEEGIASIKPASGRMQMLSGINGSKIIDDTYNASPEAVKAALKTLYRLKADQKIAILGNMNELGKYSEEEHKKIGELCDPKKLDLVVTIGPDANKYLAPTAKDKGCKVASFKDPYLAGQFVKLQLESKALVLAKGSQNKVFAEETVKLLLDNPADSSKLVRQSAYWLKIKRKNFK